MKLAIKNAASGSAIAAAILLLGAQSFAQQAAPNVPGQMVEDVFKNVQVMKGIPVNQFINTMGFFSAALGLNCTGCHVAESLVDQAKFGEDIPRKRMARNMIRMVDAINKANFGGRRALTCYTCHRGTQVPETVPSLFEQYSVAPEDPNRIESAPDGPSEPTPDQILDKYISASGGAQRLGALTSWTAKGTVSGYDTYRLPVPAEIYAKAPAQRTMIFHTQNGDSTWVTDGSRGWVAAVTHPLPLEDLVPPGETDAARLDAALSFPGAIKSALKNWKGGFPPTSIDDKTVLVIQGNGDGGSRFKLYFDEQTGLLTRQVRYQNTVIGTVPEQVDYSDYREIPGAGVKLPYHMVITWTDGQSDITLSEIQANAAIDPSRFAKPAPAQVKPRGAAR